MKKKKKTQINKQINKLMFKILFIFINIKHDRLCADFYFIHTYMYLIGKSFSFEEIKLSSC